MEIALRRVVILLAVGASVAQLPISATPTVWLDAYSLAGFGQLNGTSVSTWFETGQTLATTRFKPHWKRSQYFWPTGSVPASLRCVSTAPLRTSLWSPLV